MKVKSIVEIKNLENGNIPQEIDNVSILKASVVFCMLNINSPLHSLIIIFLSTLNLLVGWFEKYSNTY